MYILKSPRAIEFVLQKVFRSDFCEFVNVKQIYMCMYTKICILYVLKSLCATQLY